MPEETVTLTVKALREMVLRDERGAMWFINLPYTGSHNYQRTIEFREVGRTNDDAELLFRYIVNGRCEKETRVSVSEIFSLVEDVRKIVQRSALLSET